MINSQLDCTTNPSTILQRGTRQTPRPLCGNFSHLSYGLSYTDQRLGLLLEISGALLDNDEAVQHIFSTFPAQNRTFSTHSLRSTRTTYFAYSFLGDNVSRSAPRSAQSQTDSHEGPPAPASPDPLFAKNGCSSKSPSAP